MQREPLGSTADLLNIAQLVPCTEAEGPGKRFALWFQGCPLRCPGCCNPEMLPFDGGSQVVLGEVVAQIQRAVEQYGIEGITLLGGEPLAHAAGAAALARVARALGVTVMVFTGFTLEEARSLPDPAVADLLEQTDILVDGPYIRELPETAWHTLSMDAKGVGAGGHALRIHAQGVPHGPRRWIGSTNQRIHFLSDFYSADDPRWLLSNTLEIRLSGNAVMVNGFPASTAKGLWKRLAEPTAAGGQRL
jgi:anaerobic ribonucleoside-triphosphate reductase activating protein